MLRRVTATESYFYGGYRAGDFARAKTAFETLADLGDRSSLFNLGVMNHRGEAVQKDPIKEIQPRYPVSVKRN